MASEIQVQTISGPPTGANANKVIIPAGQTLDASASVLIPSDGFVVKTGNIVSNSQTTSTSSLTWVSSSLTGTFQPIYATSKVLLRASCGCMMQYVDGFSLRIEMVIDGVTTYPILRQRHGYSSTSSWTTTGLDIQGLITTNTTSPITFTLQYRCETANAIRVNPTDGAVGTNAQSGTIILQEIAG